MRELLDALDELTRRYYSSDIEVEDYVAEVNMITDQLRRYQ
ncbi:hypothetical protein [Chitinophaga sp.]